MKEIELLKDYKNINFGCNMDDLHSQIEEAIKELEAHITTYQVIRRRLDQKVATIAVLQDENKALVKILTQINEEVLNIKD